MPWDMHRFTIRQRAELEQDAAIARQIEGVK
jgi:hypothetical protein